MLGVTVGGVGVVQERMAALQSAVAEDEATERELELDAQLAEARAIIHEQVSRPAPWEQGSGEAGCSVDSSSIFEASKRARQPDSVFEASQWTRQPDSDPCTLMQESIIQLSMEGGQTPQ
jgi:hypothetical protein